MNILGFAAGALAAAALWGTAEAASVVIPFDVGTGGGDGSAVYEVEEGFTYVNNSSYRDIENDRFLYLHDDGGGRMQSTFTRVGGGQFDAVSVDMRGYTRTWRTVAGPFPGDVPPGEEWKEFTSYDWDCEFYDCDVEKPMHWVRAAFDNFVWRGYRGDALVASQVGRTAMDWDFDSWAALTFSDSFRNIDRLELRALLPKNSRLDGSWRGNRYIERGWYSSTLKEGEYGCTDSWCVGVQADNLNLVPAPLPATLPLLAAALGGLGWALRRRRS